MQKRCILIWDVHQAYLSKFGYHKTGDGGGGGGRVYGERGGVFLPGI